MWVDQCGEFHNKLFKRFLKISNIEMHSTYNEVKSVVAERFTRTLKNKTFKHMTAVSKSVYFDVLDEFVNKYNNTVHRTITMKPISNETKILMKKTLNSKLVIILRIQNIKYFC